MPLKTSFSMLLIVFSMATLGDSTSEVEHLYSLYGDQDLVSIATGTPQPVINAPAVTSTITAENIRLMGARELHEVLATIPGMHTSRSGISTNSTYVVRGNYSRFNQRILVLIDGVPSSGLYFNNRGLSWSGMSTRNIERIEVVRGPGSAIYGADAFTGVINIITNNYDSGKNTAGISVGSHDTHEAWLSYKSQWKGLKSIFHLQVSQTDGSSGTLQYDAASTTTNNVSHAPDELNFQRDSLDGNWKLAADNWLFQLDYQGRFNVGTGAGHAGALNPEGEQNAYRLTAGFQHQLDSVDHNWQLTTDFSVRHLSENIDLKLFPDQFLNIYTDGMIGEPSYKEEHYRWTSVGVYEGLKNHKVRVGLGKNHGRLFDVHEYKNFDSRGAPLGSLVDATDNPGLIYINPHSRNLNFLFIQDVWDIAPDWTLTAGIRYDDYSDFGDTINQRLALVWQADYNLTVKFLYGSAFRPPSFADLYVINNPAVNGNAHLSPEKADTSEIAFLYRPASDMAFNVNVYYSRMKDLVENVTASGNGGVGLITENIGRHESTGIEAELVWQPKQNIKLSGHYSYQSTRDKNADEAAGLAPDYLFYLQLDYFSGHWSYTTQINRVGPSKRAPGDGRKDIDDYTTVNINMRYRYSPAWDISLNGRNIFDEDIRDPGLTGSDDLPGIKRSIHFTYNFYF